MTTPTTAQQAYAEHLMRLSRASVDKHWEPYIDIPWEDPGFTVRPDDPRWILPATDRLGGTPGIWRSRRRSVPASGCGGRPRP